MKQWYTNNVIADVILFKSITSAIALVEIIVEPGEGNVYTIGVPDAGLAVSGETRHGEGHGYAVVHVAVEDSAVKGTAATDDHAVVCGSDVTAHGPAGWR